MILSVQNPYIFDLEIVRDFLVEALAADVAPELEQARQWMASRLPSEDLGVFLRGSFGAGFDGLAIIQASPTGSAFSPDAWILYFFSKPGSGAHRELIGAMEKWADQRELSEVWALNRTRHKDNAYAKFLRGEKFVPSMDGRLIRYTRVN